MDYEKIYNSLVESARHRGVKREIGYEVHHILPRCMGGSNKEQNLVKFTLREHFVAHRLLTKFVKGLHLLKMRQAMVLMCGTSHINISSRLFEIIKTQRNLSARSIKVESFGTPSTHFPIGYLSNLFKNKYNPPSHLETSGWLLKTTAIYHFSLHVARLGYDGISLGGAPLGKSYLKALVVSRVIKEAYTMKKGRCLLYDFTQEFLDFCKEEKRTTWLPKIADELATTKGVKGLRGYGIARISVREYNLKNSRKLVGLVWSKKDPYIKKINAWEGELPDLVLKHQLKK